MTGAGATALLLVVDAHREHVLEVGYVDSVPGVGDYVEREGGWYGIVIARHWDFRKKGVFVTCILDGKRPAR